VFPVTEARKIRAISFRSFGRGVLLKITRNCENYQVKTGVKHN
jgi:hypothetical protein